MSKVPDDPIVISQPPYPFHDFTSSKLQFGKLNLEWQVFHDTENTEKSRKLSTKWKIMENSLLVTQNKKYIRNSLFLEYCEVNCFIKILRLVKMLLKFNKQILSMWMWYRLAYPADLCTFRHCIPQKNVTYTKIPEITIVENHGI